MPTRLKVLSGLLVLSIVYAAVTSILDSRESNTINTAADQVKTATASSIPSKEKSDDIVIINKYKTFKELPDENNNKLTTWGPDPFRGRITKNNKRKEKKEKKVNVSDPIKDLKRETPSFEFMNIESVAVIGESKIVIINGQRYREGDWVNNMLIEKINPKNVTFLSGKTKIIKSVGS